MQASSHNFHVFIRYGIWVSLTLSNVFRSPTHPLTTTYYVLFSPWQSLLSLFFTFTFTFLLMIHCINLTYCSLKLNLSKINLIN